jgi:dihydrofolate reductase
MSVSTGRRVVANISLTLDGYYHGPGGPGDLSAIIPYATSEVSRNFLARVVAPATTALLGRVNAEGFMGYWPTVIGADGVDPREEGYAKWLVATEKVVLSRTLTEAPWERTRIVNAPTEEVVADLKKTGRGDILVNNSASVIKALLAADALDRLEIFLCPEIVGGGSRLFNDGLPGSKWMLTNHDASELGEILLTYDRIR